MKWFLWVAIAIYTMIPWALKAQNDPLQGQDSLLLELERTEVLPQFNRTMPIMEHIKPDPEVSSFSYTPDTFSFAPVLPAISLKEENLQKPTWEKLSPAYIRLGMGIWLNPSIQVALAQTRDVGIDWSIWASHRSNHRNWVGLSSLRDEQIQLKAAWLQPNYQAYTKINFRNQGYFWYADSALAKNEKAVDSLRMSYTVFSFLLGIKKIQSNGLSYDFPIEIRNYSDKLKLKEFNFKASPQLEYISESGIGAGIRTFFQTASGLNDSLFPNRMWFWADVIGMYKKDHFSIEAGVRLNYVKPDSQSFQVYPLLAARYRVLPKLTLLAQVSGSASHLSLYDLRQENRFLGRSFSLQTYREKIKAELGAQAQVQTIQIRVSGGYKLIGNLPVYTAVYQSDTIEQIYREGKKHFILYDSKTSQTYVQASLSYLQKNYNIGIDAFYSNNHLTQGKIWFHYPTWKIKLWTEVQIQDKFFFRLQPYILGARPLAIVENKTVKSPVLVDLQLTMEYKIHPNVSIWLEGNNLCNQKYQKWYLYQEMPLNVSAGVGVKL